MKPCQTARLYWRRVGPNTARRRRRETGPIVSAGHNADDQAGHDEQLDRKAHPGGGSCGVRGRSFGGGPKNTSMNEPQGVGDAEQAGQRGDVGQRTDRASEPSCVPMVSAKNISFERKPLSSGTPAIAAAATIASVAVIGMNRNRPLSRRMSRVPVSWSMMPAAMNSDALKVAWFIMWKIAATSASGLFRPSSSVIKPEMADGGVGEHALQVVLEHREDRRPSRSVTRPADPTIQNQSSVPASTGHSRASRNTPAFTIVAECR